jgi:hypothetical protein
MTEETRGIGAWLRTHLPDGAVIIIVSMIAGAIAGLCAFGLHKGIALLGGLLSSPLRLDGGNWLFLVYAVVAFLGAVIFQKSIKQNLADSTVQIKIRLNERRYRFPLSYIFTPQFSRFFSTQVFVNLRYDSNADKTIDPKWKRFMLKEILSIGLSYTFSTK